MHPGSRHYHGGLALLGVLLSLPGGKWAGRYDLYCDGRSVTSAVPYALAQARAAQLRADGIPAARRHRLDFYILFILLCGIIRGCGRTALHASGLPQQGAGRRHLPYLRVSTETSFYVRKKVFECFGFHAFLRSSFAQSQSRILSKVIP
jgi:hypothetical protein